LHNLIFKKNIILNFYFLWQIKSNNQAIGQVHKKLKLDNTEYGKNEPNTSGITSRLKNDGIENTVQGKIN